MPPMMPSILINHSAQPMSRDRLIPDERFFGLPFHRLIRGAVLSFLSRCVVTRTLGVGMVLYTSYLDPTGWPFRSRARLIGEDGYAKSTLIRLGGLFSANNNRGNKGRIQRVSNDTGDDPTTPTTTSKIDESEFPSTTTPPTTLGLYSSFEPPFQQEYELELQLSSSERPRLPSLPRRQLPLLLSG